MILRGRDDDAIGLLDDALQLCLSRELALLTREGQGAACGVKAFALDALTLKFCLYDGEGMAG